MKEPAADSPYRNQATRRVLDLLAGFAGSEPSYGVSELSRATGMNKNMVHRMLATLVETGYVVRDASGQRYQLGYRVLDLRVEDEGLDLRVLCRPTLEELHRATRESVFLSIIVGASRVNIDWIEAEGRRVSFGERGRSAPLHNNKMSRLLLAYLRDPEIDDYLAAAAPLDQFQNVTLDSESTSVERIWRDIRAMRGASHLCWRSAGRFSAAYISFPIPGSDGRLHGIITIGGPVERFDPEEAVGLEPVRASIESLQRRARIFTPPPFMMTEGIAR